MVSFFFISLCCILFELFFNFVKRFLIFIGELLENFIIRSNDIVFGVILNVSVWSMWRDFIEVIFVNDIDWVSNIIEYMLSL